MAFVVAEPCIGTKDRACVEVCPVECFYEGQDQLYIHPEECIDCAACEPVCPVNAIFPEANVPEQWKHYIQKNVDFTKGTANPPKALTKAMRGDQDNFAHTFTVEDKTIQLPPPPPGYPPPGAKVEVPKAEAPKAEPAPAQVATAVEEKAAPAPQVEPTIPSGDGGPSASATEVKPATPAPKAEAPAAKGEKAAPAAPKAAPKPAAPPMAPKAEPAAVDVESYEKAKDILLDLVEMLSGAKELDLAFIIEAEKLAKTLKAEITKVVGKETFGTVEVEKKGMLLRQKYDLAKAILERVDAAGYLVQLRRKKRMMWEYVGGGLITGGVAALCQVLAVRSALESTFLPNMPSSLQELLKTPAVILDILKAPFTPEGLAPFLGFSTLAGLMGLFALYAVYKVFVTAKEIAALKDVLKEKRIDPKSRLHISGSAATV